MCLLDWFVTLKTDGPLYDQCLHETALFLGLLMIPGRGHHMREGVQGFARAALAGGIPCLLASKWNVPVKESIILMTRVYAYMAMHKV